MAKKPTPEALACDCDDGGDHTTTEVTNPAGENELIVECSVCHRFLKHPA